MSSEKVREGKGEAEEGCEAAAVFTETGVFDREVGAKRILVGEGRQDCRHALDVFFVVQKEEMLRLFIMGAAIVLIY